MASIPEPPPCPGQRPSFLMTHFTKSAERKFKQLYQESTPDDREHLIWAIANPVPDNICKLITRHAKYRTHHFPVRGQGARRISFQQLDKTTCCIVDVSKHAKFDTFALRDRSQYDTLTTKEEVMTRCQTEPRRSQPVNTPAPLASSSQSAQANGYATDSASFFVDVLRLLVDERLKPQVEAAEARLKENQRVRADAIAKDLLAVKKSAEHIHDVSTSQQQQLDALEKRLGKVDSVHTELTRAKETWEQRVQDLESSLSSHLHEGLGHQAHRLDDVQAALQEFTTTITTRLDHAGVDALPKRVSDLSDQFAQTIKVHGQNLLESNQAALHAFQEVHARLKAIAEPSLLLRLLVRTFRWVSRHLPERLVCGRRHIA